jgi:8-oxo-dGTP pyrophosphatase MutT (NUDIX family)
MGKGGEVVFVEHPTRGWEIPGGHLEQNETPEEALLRELREETGLDGKVVRWNTSYYPEGWVAHVTVADAPVRPWNVGDESVVSVKWWSDVPPVKTWTVEEFQDLGKLFSKD